VKAYVDNPAATAKALHGVEGELEEGMVGLAGVSNLPWSVLVSSAGVVRV